MTIAIHEQFVFVGLKFRVDEDYKSLLPLWLKCSQRKEDLYFSKQTLTTFSVGHMYRKGFIWRDEFDKVNQSAMQEVCPKTLFYCSVVYLQMVLKFKAHGLDHTDNFINLIQRDTNKHFIFGKENTTECKGLNYKDIDYFGFYTCPNSISKLCTVLPHLITHIYSVSHFRVTEPQRETLYHFDNHLLMWIAAISARISG